MAIDIFLKIDGIDGESTDDAHRNWIELLSYDHGLAQSIIHDVGGGGNAAGRANFQDFSVAKELDRTTPELNSYCASGKQISKIEVELVSVTDDRPTFMKYTLENCLISQVQINGSSGDNKPTEEAAFAYQKISWEYTEIDPRGAPGDVIKRSWNLETNRPE